MNQKAQTLRACIADLETQLKQHQGELNVLIKNCGHDYSPVVYDPIIRDAYTIPGDPPGTMGVDWRGPVHVPREIEPRWKRECLKCGLVEYTKSAEERIEKIPVWPRNFSGGAR